MGCCFSSPDGPNSPYPGGAPSASARAINASRGVGSGAVVGGGAGRGVAGAIAADGHGLAPALAPVGDDLTPASSSTTSVSSPSTIASSRIQAAAAAAPAIPAHMTRLPPPREGLAAHINRPIRRRRWVSRSRVWTRPAIDRERTDFFDTRVTGRPEIWQTLHAALEIMWEADLVDTTRRGGHQGADAGAADPMADPTGEPSPPTSPAANNSSTEADEARATAQTMLDAADITLPTGDMAQGAYDAFGNFYLMPAWIVSDPANLDNSPEADLEDAKAALEGVAGSIGEDSVSEGESDVTSGDDGGHGHSLGSEDEDEGDHLDNNDDDASSRRRRRRRHRREEKGKAVLVAAADLVAVRARLSTTSRDVLVRLGRDETVHSLVHRIAEKAKFPHGTHIRIAYLGKILKEGSSLTAQGWVEGHVVNALVFGPPQASA